MSSPVTLTVVKLFPHIKYVVDKYKQKLPRDDLKRFAKQVGWSHLNYRITSLISSLKGGQETSRIRLQKPSG